MYHGPPFKMVYDNNAGFGIEAISTLKVNCIVSSCVLGMLNLLYMKEWGKTFLNTLY